MTAPVAPTGTTVTPVTQQVQTGEVMQTIRVQGSVAAAQPTAGVVPTITAATAPTATTATGPTTATPASMTAATIGWSYTNNDSSNRNCNSSYDWADSLL